LSAERARVEALLSKAEELVDQAEKTDYRMSVILPFLPAILASIGIILLIIGMLAGLGEPEVTYYPGYTSVRAGSGAGLGLAGVGAVLMIIGIILNFYVVYKWVKRRNDHFRRTLAFSEVVAEIAELLRFKRAHAVKSRLNELREVNTKMKDPIANAILIIVPFYIFYVFHFLNKDFAKHSEKERLLLAELIEDIRERYPHFTRRVDELEPVPDRSTLLYVILTLVTGLFLVYWVYTLTKDPNKHFEAHSLMEREILTALREIAAQG
jgi:hypothetical protein